MVLRQPIGVVSTYSPWNFPVSSPARKVSGALAAGCSIVLKASEETPAGAVQLVRAFVDAGLPPGVLNLVFGRPADVSDYLIPQPAVRLVTFTRSANNVDRLAEGVGAGNLSINQLVASVPETPFGGVKESGYGREGGTEGLDGYTVAKSVSYRGV